MLARSDDHTWAVSRRLDYIDWRLAAHGQIQRGDIMRVFGVSMAQVSIDIAAFERAHSGAMKYDKTAKRYVPGSRPYRSRRGWTAKAREALAALAAVHPMGWGE